ncbi:MAG: RHS repeat-associated core domain-containing protein [Brevundimonas sp.]|uniref:RHS repeat-associated core domain-containing protein n=1 Tax=Brevundimonas sp. TaxID=1871086 RepID=UPI00391B356D
MGWFHTDHQGSVIAVTDASGHAVQTASYSPYGEFAMPGQMPPGPGAGGGVFGYTGRQYDAETGLYQYRARYYHPRLGQFLSTDPIGTKDDPNLTLYVLADPVNLTDPTGLKHDRGEGFSNSQWSRVRTAQRSIANRFDRAASSLEVAVTNMQSGNNITMQTQRTITRYEAVMGQGAGTAENMMASATHYRTAALILRNDSGSGSYIHGRSADEWADMGRRPSVFAIAHIGERAIYINTAHSSFGDDAALEWVLGHETFHSENGLEDQSLNGIIAYRYHSPSSFQDMINHRPDLTVINPDHLMEFAFR